MILLILILLPSCVRDHDTFYAYNLKCEYMVNPMGIDIPNPRLTWQMNDKRAGARQNSYQIFAGTDSILDDDGSGNVWNSGKVNSSNNLVRYKGKTLEPHTKYYWKVLLRDNKSRQSERAGTVSFETGKMSMRNWRGEWIADTRDVDLKPAPYFRKTFDISKEIKTARVYIAVAGLYELYLNGLKVGDQRLDPAFTHFDRRTLYLTHDVTNLIKNGKNAIGVLLGNGWYNHQSKAVWLFDEAPWRARPSFCLDLRVTYTDGTTAVITSSTDWKTSLSPIIFNSIYTAEHYDARQEQPGWSLPEFDDSTWNKPFIALAPSLNIVPQVMHPIRITEEIPPKTITRPNSNTWVFDLGRNIAGISKLVVKGQEGTVVKLKHAELLDEKGYADLSNIDRYSKTIENDRFQTDIFILSGKGEETFIHHLGSVRVIQDIHRIEIPRSPNIRHSIFSNLWSYYYCNSLENHLYQCYKENLSLLTQIFL